MKTTVVNHPGGVPYSDWIEGKADKGKNLSDQLSQATKGKTVAAIAPVTAHEGRTVAFVIVTDE